MDTSPWAVSWIDGTFSYKQIGLDDCIEHPDCWMLPIRDEELQQALTSEVNLTIQREEAACVMSEMMQGGDDECR